MATPNYGYEKRQKELAKKRKKEDKLKQKADRKVNPGDEHQLQGDNSLQSPTPSSDPPPQP